MEAEAAPFVEHLGLKPAENIVPAPFVAYSGVHKNCHLTVVTNGKDAIYGTGVDNVGTIPATLVTYLALQSLKTVDLVLNAGTCGGFERKGAAIGDVFLTTAVANHDRRIPIPPFIPYGVGLLATLQTPLLAKEYSYKQGICTTSNSLDHTEECRSQMESNDASVKDMEAAAIAWSAALYETKPPYLGVKVVTDIVDGDRPAQEEFMENLSVAAKSLQDALPKVIEFVCGKTVSEL
jgi:5'-methylthioadenosine nucleosidase